MAKSTKSTYHADWLNLTDRSGLVLSEPVLLEHFSEGFKQPNNWLTKQIKHAYEKFDLSDYANASLGFTDAILELFKHTLIKSNAIPSELIVYLPEYAQDLRPQRVLHVNERFIPIYVSEKNQNLRTNENLEGKWRASPIAKCERLIKETKSTFGIVTNGSTWRLIYLSSEGSINYIEFDFESMMQEGRLLSAFVAILSSDILAKLKELAEESHKKQIEITDKLGFQVRESVIKFIKILDRANKESKSELLYGVPNDTIYQMSVSTIIKLVFVLYAEQKSMLPHGELLYDKAYGLHTLMSLLNEQKASEELAHRSDAYQQILALFNIIYHGSNHPDMLSPRYSGEIFDPQKFPLLFDERFEPKNEEIYEILWLLTHAEGKIGKETITQSFSYHSLNVEHIGYIYEGLLAYSVDRSGQTPLIKFAPKGNEYAIKADELLHVSDDKLGEFIKNNTQQNKAPTAKQLENRFAPDQEALEKLVVLEPEYQETLKPYASLIHEVVPSFSLYLSTSTKRRATGAHYTPEALTAKMVKTTLDPHLYNDQGTLKSAKEILSLKIADIAMGSGAFLVQTIRYMSERLVEAWQQALNATEASLCMPYALPCTSSASLPIPKEYDEQKRYAKRFVARECIYGVDINPLAVEIAKISIWLETLDKSLPFTFIDHAFKHGDSLVGVIHESEVKKLFNNQSSLFNVLNKKDLDKAIELRKEVERLSDLEVEKKKELLAKSDALLQSTKEKLAFLSANAIDPNGDLEPFSYLLEFPEVMLDNGGFDAIVGNPPFLGGQKLTGFFGEPYREYLVNYLGHGQRGSADLVAYFFLRALQLLKPQGTFGLLATNTIAEGDTREVGLAQMVDKGTIYAAFPNEPWEGQAAVVTSRVHFCKGDITKPKILNGEEVEFISPFLSAEDDKKPNTLKANENRSFIGSYVLGMGFTMTPEEAKNILHVKPHYAEALFPYINGEDLNSSPTQEPSRYVINFWDWSLERAGNYPELLAQVVERVKPERDKLNRKERRDRWWQFAEKTPALYHAIGRGRSFEKHPSDFEYPKERVKFIAGSKTSKYFTFTIFNKDMVFDQTINIFSFSDTCYFSLLSSTLHEEWARQMSSGLGGTMQYSPSNCFINFTFPEILPANPALCDFSHPLVQKLETLGEEYHELRSAMMQEHTIGLTKLYNAFHNPKETREDFKTLRELHKDIDEAVKVAYGWHDLDLAHDFYEVPYLPANDRVRYTIAEKARLEILRRLYKLNTQRYEAEVKAGLWNKKTTKPKAKLAQGGLF